jgi:hypothetical protein
MEVVVVDIITAAKLQPAWIAINQTQFAIKIVNRVDRVVISGSINSRRPSEPALSVLPVQSRAPKAIAMATSPKHQRKHPHAPPPILLRSRFFIVLAFYYRTISSASKSLVHGSKMQLNGVSAFAEHVHAHVT